MEVIDLAGGLHVGRYTTTGPMNLKPRARTASLDQGLGPKDGFRNSQRLSI